MSDKPRCLNCQHCRKTSESTGVCEIDSPQVFVSFARNKSEAETLGDKVVSSQPPIQLDWGCSKHPSYAKWAEQNKTYEPGTAPIDFTDPRGEFKCGCVTMAPARDTFRRNLNLAGGRACSCDVHCKKCGGTGIPKSPAQIAAEARENQEDQNFSPGSSDDNFDDGSTIVHNENSAWAN